MRASAWVLAILVVGCAPSEPPTSTPVRWIDGNGEAFYAPPVTPKPDDPLHADHPDAGVVAFDPTRKELVLLEDPTATLNSIGSTGPPRQWIFFPEGVEPPSIPMTRATP